MFSPSKYKLYYAYDSMQAYFKIWYDGELNNYIGIEFYCRPYGSIYLKQDYLVQRIINLVPGIDRLISKPTPALKPPLAKNEGSQPRKKNLTTGQWSEH